MEIYVKEDKSLVEIWLTQVENADTALRERLKPLYRQYAEKKYLVAVFCSGNQELSDMTSELLCYNRKRLAQLELEREKIPCKSAVI